MFEFGDGSQDFSIMERNAKLSYLVFSKKDSKFKDVRTEDPSRFPN